MSNRIPPNYISDPKNNSTSISNPKITFAPKPCRFEITEDGAVVLHYYPFPPESPNSISYLPAMHRKDEQGEYIATKTMEIRIAGSSEQFNG